MSLLNEQLLGLIKANPKARERKAKYKAIAFLIKKYYNVDVKDETFAAIVFSSISLDREWRKILLDNKELRGKDYGEKDKLEQDYLVKEGYAPEPNEKKFKEKVYDPYA